MIIYFSLLIALAGLLLYYAAANPKNQEVGRIMFFCGLLAFLLRLSSESVNLLPR